MHSFIRNFNALQYTELHESVLFRNNCYYLVGFLNTVFRFLERKVSYCRPISKSTIARDGRYTAQASILRTFLSGARCSLR